MSDGIKDQESLKDPYHLDRFLEAQHKTYTRALMELQAGSKKNHWMWYIFPQFHGLGTSADSVRYAIGSLDEARAYLAHPVLGARLLECSRVMLGHGERSALEILGPPDDIKLRSSATLFSMVSPPGSTFHALLDRFFGGKADPITLELAGQP